MTGAEHYRRAEKLIDKAQQSVEEILEKDVVTTVEENAELREMVSLLIQHAQAHATLAQAAATALATLHASGPTGALAIAEINAWATVSAL